jgi:hypothetical protein
VTILHGLLSLLVRLNTKAFASHFILFEQSQEAVVYPPNIFEDAKALIIVNVLE